MTLYSDIITEECWVRVAAGSLARASLSGGYTDRLTDVEHSAEETGDTLTSILLLQPDNTTYRDWAANTIPHLALRLWTGVNEKGGLQFRSTYFTSEKVSGNMLLACDTAYHTRQDPSDSCIYS